MEEIIRDNPHSDDSIQDEEKLLPEIAKLLNVSVSTLNTLSADIRNALCLTYINQYPLGEESTLQALHNVLDFDVSQEVTAVANTAKEQVKENSGTDVFHRLEQQVRQSQKSDEEEQNRQQQELAQKNEHKKVKRDYILTRAQFNKNAKIIARKYKAKCRWVLSNRRKKHGSRRRKLQIRRSFNERFYNQGIF